GVGLVVLVLRLDLDEVEPDHLAVASAGLAADLLQLGELALEVLDQDGGLLGALLFLLGEELELAHRRLGGARALLADETAPSGGRPLLPRPLEEGAEVEADRDGGEEWILVVVDR